MANAQEEAQVKPTKQNKVIKGVVTTEAASIEVGGTEPQYDPIRLKKDFNPIKEVTETGEALYKKGMHPRALRAKAEGRNHS